MEKIKNCPCCGGEAKMEHINFAIIHHADDCILKGIRRLWRDATEYNFKAWNTRSELMEIDEDAVFFALEQTCKILEKDKNAPVPTSILKIFAKVICTSFSYPKNPTKLSKEWLRKEVQLQYKIYGYEKQHYLKEILENFFNTKFKLDGE